jgi:hypothetical protein
MEIVPAVYPELDELKELLIFKLVINWNRGFINV